MAIALALLALAGAGQSKTLTTSDPTFGVVCPESEDGMSVFVPHPTNCSLYYHCVGTTPVLMSCPGDLYFSPVFHICTWPELAECKTDPQETTTSISTFTSTIRTTSSEDLTNTEAVIVTGGRVGDSGAGGFKSVEVIRGDGTTCTLPNLPANTEYHSQSGLITCGGGTDLSVGFGVDDTFCTTFTNGSWITTHNLTVPRRFHTSWKSNSGIMLIGGTYIDNASRSTELLSNTSSTSTLAFTLPYDTRCGILLTINNQLYTPHFSSACSIEIPVSDTVVITGGLNRSNSGISRVQEYSWNGTTHQLASLQEPRWGHACGFYQDNMDQIVGYNLPFQYLHNSVSSFNKLVLLWGDAQLCLPCLMFAFCLILLLRGGRLLYF